MGLFGTLSIGISSDCPSTMIRRPPSDLYKAMITNQASLLLILIVVGIEAVGAFVQTQDIARNACRFESENGNDRAQRIMYNQQAKKREDMRYKIIAAEACEPLARRMEEVSFERQ